MNTAERVVNYLTKHPNETICDACLQKELGASRPLNRMLDVMNPAHVSREVALCKKCGVTRPSVTLIRQP